MKKNTNHERSRIDFDKYAIAAETGACSNFRRASGALTQMFDHALQPTGLRSTQLIILLEIAVARHASASQLARRLVMDPSTLARNLKLIMKPGWIKSKASRSGRGQKIGLTSRGMKTVQKAVPLWEQSQTAFTKQLGERRWRTL
jgi:DNA-binding MarR family transcriptional regulator